MIAAYLNNALTPEIYCSIGLFLILFNIRIYYKKYQWIFIEHVTLSILVGLLWIVALPCFLIWKVSEKLDEFFFLDL